MKKSAKIWLCLALLLSVCTAGMYIDMGVWPASLPSLVSMFGICLLIIKEKKLGFYIMCVCALLSGLAGAFLEITAGAPAGRSIFTYLFSSALVPAVTAFLIRKQWKELE